MIAVVDVKQFVLDVLQKTASIMKNKNVMLIPLRLRELMRLPYRQRIVEHSRADKG